jgi:hypothetical protein
MEGIWLSIAVAGTALLLVASALERQIKRILRSRWSSFDYDGLTLLSWGVAALGATTMLLFLALALDQAWPAIR